MRVLATFGWGVFCGIFATVGYILVEYYFEVRKRRQLQAAVERRRQGARF